ncbi:MAG TPA: DUF4130 domain-containing protein [Methanotrichaceae archaeon]|nr:DUF4130 domain-containing protein [Methanotrichaceae archaeon]HQF16814.1 DUF4130 domain-containing protein [Methanotrichaceae archaeon]HQI90140.1 DUF4130 domain-containing protein [Methanotrichaceae archaeon]HQJ29138.1 DUF4130 domain-containing protein [Methanotrichaceae archaeon]
MIPEDFLVVLQAHRDCSKRLLEAAAKRTPREVELGQSRLDQTVRTMVREVLGEAHRMKGMVRLSSAGEATLCGYLRPRHDIGFMVAGHLARRFSGTVIVLGNAAESWACLCLAGRLYFSSGGPLFEMPDVQRSDLKDKAAALWDAYYQSQDTGGSTLEAFSRRMPATARRAAMSRERRTGSSLEDFI